MGFNRGLVTFLAVLTSIYSSVKAVENGGSITIDLSSLNASETYVKTREVLHGSARVRLENLSPSVGFYVVQVHSFAVPVLLSRINSDGAMEAVNGTNVGLIQKQMETDEEYDYYIEGVDHTHVLIVVVAYDIKVPMPGGCNLTFDVQDAPYQKVSYTEAIIKVDAQPPRVDGFFCGQFNISADFYHMYMEEQDFSAESYFDGIEKMITPKEVTKNARKVGRPAGLPQMRRFFAAYQGVGTVYGIIADFKGFKSAYVSAVSYGCDINASNSCTGPMTTQWKIICGFMVFYGLFLCYLGHRFFQLNLFCIGFIVAAILTYIVVSYTNLTDWEILITLAITGVIYGGIWLVIWWKFRIPILSVTLTYFVTGLLISGIFFYSGSADLDMFRSDTNFWSVLIGISLLITILLLIVSHWPSNIIATSFIGAYIFIIPFDVYFGGTLRYILLNVIHRATVSNFKIAIVDPPYQSTEVTLIISLILVALLGMYVQWRQVRGRAPFPPANIWDRPMRTVVSEATPLLTEPDPNSRYYNRM